jgi:hypothetical protein
VTAGVLSELGNAMTIDGKALNSVQVSDGFAANVGKNLITGLTRATINSAVAGTDLETSIRTEVVAGILGAASAQGANWIGDLAQPGAQGQAAAINEFGRAFAHAVAGCAAGAAGASAPGSNTSAGSGCGAGALGAVVGELSAQLYGAADPAKTVAFASMVSGIAAAVAGQGAQGVSIAASTGANAAQNNYLTHQQAENKKTELSKAKTPQEVAAIEAKYHKLDAAQQTAAEQCLLDGNCQSVTDPLMLQGALNDLKNACAMPRYCSPDEVKSIAQLNRLLDKDAITPNHLLEELVIGGGVGKIVGAGISSLAARVFGGAVVKAVETNMGALDIAARQATAKSFYQAGGWPEARITSHLEGINFSQPVENITLPRGTQVVQYQIPGNPTGNYFAPVGTSAESIGVNPAGRVTTIYTTMSDVSVLRSTAANTSLNPNLPALARGQGGGVQFFTTNPSAFTPIP